MNDIQILDDFLPSYIQDFLEGGFYENMSLKLIKKSLPSGVKNDYFDDEQLECWVKSLNSGDLISLGKSHFYLLPLQIGSLKLGINFNLENLFRAKLNIKFNHTHSNSLKINPPHIDNNYIRPFFIAIYYVNDSDGNTIIYEGENINNLTPIKEIEPKKGRLILFDGRRYHSASHPINSKKRIIMNYNIFY